MNQIIPVHIFPCNIRSNSTFKPTLVQPNGLFALGFPTEIPQAFLFSPVHATSLIYLIFFDFITIKTYGE